MSRTRIQAFRHEITGQFYAMSVEDRTAFDAHCKAIRDDYNPQPGRELWLAQAVAEDMWRLDRARGEESNIYALSISGEIGESSPCDSPEVHSAVCHARTWLKDGKMIQALALYETRVRRNMEKSQKELNALQAERRTRYQEALEEAKLLAQFAEYEGETLDSAQDEPGDCGTYPAERSQPGVLLVNTEGGCRPYPAERSQQGILLVNTEGGCRPYPAERGQQGTLLVNGFAFSTSEIIALVRREARVAKARELQSQGWKPLKTVPKAA